MPIFSSDNFNIITSFLASVGGATVILGGLSTWLGKMYIQKYIQAQKAKDAEVLEGKKGEITRELEKFRSEKNHLLEHIKAEITKRQFAFSKQYEKEFVFYQEFWKNTVDFYSAVLALRPPMDIYPPEEAKETRKANRIAKYQESENRFRHCLLYSKPFFSGEIFTLAQDLHKFGNAEATNYNLSDIDAYTNLDKAVKTKEHIMKLAEEICASIQKRIRDVELAISQTSYSNAA